MNAGSGSNFDTMALALLSMYCDVIYVCLFVCFLNRRKQRVRRLER